MPMMRPRTECEEEEGIAAMTKAALSSIPRAPKRADAKHNAERQDE